MKMLTRSLLELRRCRVPRVALCVLSLALCVGCAAAREMPRAREPEIPAAPVPELAPVEAAVPSETLDDLPAEAVVVPEPSPQAEESVQKAQLSADTPAAEPEPIAVAQAVVATGNYGADEPTATVVEAAPPTVVAETVSSPPAAPAPDLPAPPTVSTPVLSAADAVAAESRALSLEVEGRGPVEPGSLLLAHPGDSVSIRLTVDGAAPAGKSGDGGYAMTTAGKFLMESSQRVAVELQGGALLPSNGDTIVWTAPRTSGLQTLGFEVEERFAYAGSGAGSSGSASRLRATGHLAVMVLHPFDREGRGVLGSYPIGLYPNENGSDANSFVQRHVDLYKPPAWFLHVTPEVEKLHLSKHLRVGDFSPLSERGQEHFIAVQPRLVDFIEALWMTARAEFGEDARLMVLRAYMSPNERQRLAQQGVTYTRFGRYQYGDGVALCLNLDGGEGMSDLNADGVVNMEDARRLGDLVDRLQVKRRNFGWLGAFEEPKEPDWPKTPFVAFDLRGVKVR